MRRVSPGGLLRSQPAGPGHQRAPLSRAGQSPEGRPSQQGQGCGEAGGVRRPAGSPAVGGRPLPLSADCPGGVRASGPPAPSPEADGRVCLQRPGAWSEPDPAGCRGRGLPGGKSQEDLCPAAPRRFPSLRGATSTRMRALPGCERCPVRKLSSRLKAALFPGGWGDPVGGPHSLHKGLESHPLPWVRNKGRSPHCRIEAVGGRPCGPAAETALPVQGPRFNPRSGNWIPRAATKTQRSQIK